MVKLGLGECLYLGRWLGCGFVLRRIFSTEWIMIFDDRYEVFLADTPESKALHYQLRYQVYCEETGWERSPQFLQEKLERDDFDASSHHSAILADCQNP